MIILVVVAIFVLIAFNLKTNMLGPLKDMISPSSSGNPDVPSPQALVSSVETGFLSVDSMVVIIAVGIGLGSVLLAYMTKSALPLLIFSILIAVIMLVVMPAMSNTFRSMSASSSFTGIMDNSLPMTKFIMANLPLFGLVFAVLIIVVVYGKTRGSGE